MKSSTKHPKKCEKQKKKKMIFTFFHHHLWSFSPTAENEKCSRKIISGYRRLMWGGGMK
jgi:hypothetical protein